MPPYGITRPQWVENIFLNEISRIWQNFCRLCEVLHVLLMINEHHGFANSLLLIIDQFHKSQNAPVPYPTMLHSEQKCAHFCSEWSIVGYGTDAFCDLWIRSTKKQQTITRISDNPVHCHTSITRYQWGFGKVLMALHIATYKTGKKFMILPIFLELILCSLFEAYINGLVQDYSNSSALAVELLQSCTKPSIPCIHYVNLPWSGSPPVLP